MVMRYRIVYPDELNHYGVKGMKWGVRKDKPPRGRHAYKVDGRTPTRKEYRQIKKEEREDRKTAKKEYKDEKKRINKQSSEIFKTYRDAQNKNIEKFFDYKKSQKASLKNKEIDKATYKKNVRDARSTKYSRNKAAEINMAIGQYQIQKLRHANDMVYALDVNNMKAYERGKMAYHHNTESFGYGNSIYKVKKNNGKYSISRTDVYVY